MNEVSAYGIEARRWTVVFHRRASHWFFRLLAMGHFKHVSALAWVPELGQWWIYDVGFRRTYLRVLVDGQAAQNMIAAIVKGNATITLDVREDNLPLMRLGMFCTTAIAHLVGLRCVAMRPDALYRRMIQVGGTAQDHGHSKPTTDRTRSESGERAAAGAELADLGPAESIAVRYGEPDGSLWHKAGACQ